MYRPAGLLFDSLLLGILVIVEYRLNGCEEDHKNRCCAPLFSSFVGSKGLSVATGHVNVTLKSFNVLPVIALERFNFDKFQLSPVAALVDELYHPNFARVFSCGGFCIFDMTPASEPTRSFR